ncbi:MAG: hypothetical protein ACK5TG_16590 [Planctomyces sp.]|jgi:hypothetical protein
MLYLIPIVLLFLAVRLRHLLLSLPAAAAGVRADHGRCALTWPGSATCIPTLSTFVCSCFRSAAAVRLQETGLAPAGAAAELSTVP